MKKRIAMRLKLLSPTKAKNRITTRTKGAIKLRTQLMKATILLKKAQETKQGLGKGQGM